MLASGAALTYAQSAAKSPADLDPDSRSRLPYLQRKDMDESSQKIFDKLPGRSPEGVLRGPLAFAAYNPGVAQALFDLHNAAVAGSLDPHVRELAIMVACRETNYSLEWNAHEASALKAGVDRTVIEIIRSGGPLNSVNEKDAVVIRFGRQLLRPLTEHGEDRELVAGEIGVLPLRSHVERRAPFTCRADGDVDLVQLVVQAQRLDDIARSPSLARSWRRFGASAPMPPI